MCMNLTNAFLLRILVIGWLESMTRLDSSHDLWWLGLDSSHVFRKMTRDSSQSHFYNIFEFLMDKPSSFAHNEMSILCFSDDQDWRKFSVFLSSCAMLHFEDQVSPPCVEVDLRLCFHWGFSKAQYIDTLSWFNVVFAYRDHASGPHTVTLSLFQIPVKWLKFSRFKSRPKTILQNIMQMQKPNLV